MNRSAYFTTSFAIKTFANLSKADVTIEGEENIPPGPTIFVVNHFTRIETLLIPYYIFNITGIPALSLASATFFKGGLKKYLDLVGVVSTKDPKRDRIIVKSLLTGAENWIIFPEGRMVKSKKIIGDGTFLITHQGGRHKPHTGAGALALRTEFFRRQLLGKEGEEGPGVRQFLASFGIDSLEAIRRQPTSIVPVNLTYYPIRAKENIASQFAAKMVKDVPERILEELMTEGTMLFSGVDLDIHFGKPIYMDDFLNLSVVQREMEGPVSEDGVLSEKLNRVMRSKAQELMQKYMSAIYDMTTVNHEHLFAAFLERYPLSKMSEMGLRRRVFLAAKKISDRNSVGCNLHRSLKEEQVHLLTDDRFQKVANFLTLASEKGVVKKQGETLIKAERNVPDLVQFHRERIDNPIDVMVNELEPLRHVQRLIRLVAWQPDFLVKRQIGRLLLQDEKRRYREECSTCGKTALRSGGPYLLKGSSRKLGVVLVHSYLSIPEEVRELASSLNRQGVWVYVVRLAGHGTTPEDLASKSYDDWQLSVEKGVAMMNCFCRQVVLGGISIGGCLALDLASRMDAIAGVFAVCPPLRLKDYSTNFMPSLDVWKRILARLRKDDLDVDYFHFTSENEYSNYDRNPVLGVKNVGAFLEKLRPKLGEVRQPALIIHGDNDPVVDSAGSRKIYQELGSDEKRYVLVRSDRHILTSGRDAKKYHRIIGGFIHECLRGAHV